MAYHVYRIYNHITKKSYIGKTGNPTKRWREHSTGQQIRTSLIQKSIRKHGVANFSFTIIFSTDSEVECSEKELSSINEYGTMYPKGYNLSYRCNGKLTFSDKTKKLNARLRQRGNFLRYKEKGIKWIGVSKRSSGKYLASIRVDNKIIPRTFPSLNAAIEAYDKMALHVFGPTAAINKEDKRAEYLSQNLKEFATSFIGKKKASSKYRGVSRFKDGSWRARIAGYPTGKLEYSLGQFSSEDEAAKAWDMAIVLFGLNRRLNFPEMYGEYLKKDLKSIVSSLHHVKSSKYEGVCKRNSGWQAYIYKRNGKQVTIGTFSSEEEAFLARENFIKSTKD